MVSEQAWLTFELQFWVNFLFLVFWLWKTFFGVFFRLVLILRFQARLRLETCREYCLEQNPSIFVIFGAHLMIFQKLGLVWFLLLCVFCAFFWVWIEGLMFEDENLSIFVEKCAKFWAEFFFFFSKTRPCTAGGEDEQSHYGPQCKK